MAPLRIGVIGAGLIGRRHLTVLLSDEAYAVSGIAVRVLTRTDTTASVVVWTITLMTAMAGALAAPGWVPLASAHYHWLIYLGVLAAIGSYCLTEAFRGAPAAVVAPLEYTALLWGILIDRLVWGVLPSARVLSGGAVVIASGLYLIGRERTRGQRRRLQRSWQWPSRQGRMSRRSSTDEEVARQQEEDAP